jgi:hypothetical protein
MAKRFFSTSFVLASCVGLGGVGASVANANPITYDEYNVTGNTSVNVQLTGNGGDLDINVDGFGINVQAGPGAANGDLVGVITDGTATVEPQGTSLPIVKSLPQGTMVGAGDSFYQLTGFQNALLDNTDRNGEFPANPDITRYFGFEVIPAGTTTPDYGFVTIDTINDGATTNDPNGATPYAAEVVSVTYDPTGAPLAVTSAVPEPASMGLLAMGGIGLMGRRRRGK